MTDDAIRISIQKTGGFAGSTREFSLTSESLTDEQKIELDRLIAMSGLRGEKNVGQTNKKARDVFVYSFVLHEKGATTTASFDDTTLSAACKDLLQFVQSASAKR